MNKKSINYWIKLTFAIQTYFWLISTIVTIVITPENEFGFLFRVFLTLFSLGMFGLLDK